MHLTPLGFCLRVIVNENPLNLENTTSSVLFVLLLIFDLHKFMFTIVRTIKETAGVILSDWSDPLSD